MRRMCCRLADACGCALFATTREPPTHDNNSMREVVAMAALMTTSGWALTAAVPVVCAGVVAMVVVSALVAVFIERNAPHQRMQELLASLAALLTAAHRPPRGRRRLRNHRPHR